MEPVKVVPPPPPLGASWGWGGVPGMFYREEVRMVFTVAAGIALKGTVYVIVF